MKIVCDACSAKYSIADEKVKGKVFKIRCKKCSNIIVVRGAAGAAAEEPAPAQYDQKETRVYDYQGYDEGAAAAPAADDQVWHVVIDQEQVGPMTMAEVQQRFAAGQIDADTYVWREGFADWQPLSGVDVFASMVSEGGPTAVAGSGAAAVANMFGTPTIDDQATTRADSGDLFAAASARSRAAEHEDDGAGDLFGAPPAAAAAPAAQPAAQSRLRGERNENSVLFSLGNLAQLASNAPAASASASASPSAGGGGGGGGAAAAAGPAGGEGSGLIDIRSMASAYLGGEKGAAKPAAGTIGSIDDLPVFSSTAFNEPAVLMPTPGRQQNNKLLYMLIGLVGVLAIVAVVMVVIVLKGGDDKPAASVAQNEDTADSDKDKDKDTTDTAGTGGTTPTEGSAAGVMGTTPGSGAAPPPPTTGAGSAAATPPSTGGTATTPKPTTPPATAKSGSDRKKPRSSGGSKSDTSSSKATPPPTTSSSSSSDSGGGSCDEVSCVLNNYEGSCCAKFRKGGSRGGGGGGSTGSKPKSDLPEALDRSDVADGVSKVKARVQACGGKSSAKGEVKVSVKVSPDGNVTSATIKSSPDPALGSCVSSAMQKATFKKTQNGGSFSYPWRF